MKSTLTKPRLSKPSRNGHQELLKLDLGCGDNCKEGFTGVDNAKGCSAKIKHDLTVTPWPFESDSVDEVHSSHFLEHLTGPERILFMDELWRVMKVGAKATIQVPYWSSMRSVQDPTHQWPPLCEASFLYCNRGWREQNKLTHYLGKCDFDFGYGYQVSQETALRSQEVQSAWIAHNINTVSDLVVTLTKRA